MVQLFRRQEFRQGGSLSGIDVEHFRKVPIFSTQPYQLMLLEKD